MRKRKMGSDFDTWLKRLLEAILCDSASLLTALIVVFGGSGLISKGLDKTDGGSLSQPSQTLDKASSPKSRRKCVSLYSL